MIEWGCGGLETDTAHRQPLLGCNRAFWAAIAKHVIQIRGRRGRRLHFGGVVLSVSLTSRAPPHFGTGLMQSHHIHDQGNGKNRFWFSACGLISLISGGGRHWPCAGAMPH